jgi:hypothetical protein
VTTLRTLRDNAMLDAWTTVGITEGTVFRAINKTGRIWGQCGLGGEEARDVEGGLETHSGQTLVSY